MPSASVRLPNVTLPSIVTKSAMFSVRSEIETSKTCPSPASKSTWMLRGPRSMVSSTSAPVVLTRTSSWPPADTPPIAMLALPDR